MKKAFKFNLTLVLFLIMVSCSSDSSDEGGGTNPPPEKLAKTETFSFTTGGKATKGKIYLPESYESNKNLPAVYLIDYAEEHTKFIKDEFDNVINGLKKIQNFEALVVSLDEIPAFDYKPSDYQEIYDIYKDMASYVDKNYTNNTSRTLIGKASEAGIIIISLLTEDQESSVFSNFIASDNGHIWNEQILDMLEKNNVPNDLIDKKLHFSFSKSNNREQCLALIDAFEDANYPWLTFESKEYTDTDYDNTYPLAYADGLKFVFSE